MGGERQRGGMAIPCKIKHKNSHALKMPGMAAAVVSVKVTTWGSLLYFVEWKSAAAPLKAVALFGLVWNCTRQALTAGCFKPLLPIYRENRLFLPFPQI